MRDCPRAWKKTHVFLNAPILRRDEAQATATASRKDSGENSVVGLSRKDSGENSVGGLSEKAEVKAATHIQAHVRGNSTRRHVSEAPAEAQAAASPAPLHRQRTGVVGAAEKGLAAAEKGLVAAEKGLEKGAKSLKRSIGRFLSQKAMSNGTASAAPSHGAAEEGPGRFTMQGRGDVSTDPLEA